MREYIKKIGKKAKIAFKSKINNKVKNKMAYMLLIGCNPSFNISEFNNLNPQWYNRVRFIRTKKICFSGGPF